MYFSASLYLIFSVVDPDLDEQAVCRRVPPYSEHFLEWRGPCGMDPVGHVGWIRGAMWDRSRGSCGIGTMWDG